MQLIRVAAAVLNQTPMAWDTNRDNILAAIRQARQQRASILCLPELCITGYGCEDMFHAPGLQRMAQDLLFEILDETHGLIVSLGLPLMHGGGLYNTACLVVDGQIAGFVGKQNLAGEGIHYEPRWFKRWPNNVHDTVVLRGRSYPIGDLMFVCGGVLLGFEICEDAWVAHRPGADLAAHGVDIILNPSASHFAFGKHEVRQRFVLEGSRAFNVSYVYANLLGNEAGRAIYDGDAMIASGGRMLALGPRFSFADAHVTSATIDVEATRMTRARTGSFEVAFGEQRVYHVQTEFSYPPLSLDVTRTSAPAWETGPYLKEEEFTRAESLALFDYLRKSRSHGFIVSLSGGADSATVAVLCAMLVRLAELDLGLDVVRKKLAYVSRLQDAQTAADIVHQLLSCVYQSTQNSSDVTRNAARDVAQAIGADFMEIDVDALVRQYVTLISDALGRELTWATDDVALQNIQARVRAPGVWLLANLRNALLLSTSNRSEAAVGYATMDGDTSGGLAPLAGIDKNFIRHWLRWLEKVGPLGCGPIAALSAINEQAPTAELRPAARKQTDEDDLMPYDLLDAIERAAIRDKLSPVEVFLSMEPNFPQYARDQLVVWVERFFVLWSRNQWKRERYAPSFHLDDENLDPKTWCRFPILSGGFQRELEELREFARGLSQP